MLCGPTRQAPNIGPMLFRCWAPYATLAQHWASIGSAFHIHAAIASSVVCDVQHLRVVAIMTKTPYQNREILAMVLNRTFRRFISPIFGLLILAAL